MSSEIAERKRRLNDALRTSDEIGDATIAFFCECDDNGCLLPILLTGREYDLARANPNWVALWHESSVHGAQRASLA